MIGATGSGGTGGHNDVVRQGFICPFCMEDFGEYERLICHVENDHPEEDSSDLAGMFVSNVKGFFDKAKRGIQKLDAKKSIADLASNVETEFTETTEKLVERAPLPRIPKPLPPDEILPGTRRSKTREFLSTRELNINEVAVRTNMLIIRLDRLINGGPKDKDPVKRKEFEREVVPWLDDAEAVCCPLCASRFGLTRRRHHCRLCGRVLCHSCSKFLSFDTAKTLTSSSNPLGDTHIIVEEPNTVENEQELLQPEENGRRSFFSLSQKSMDKMKRAMAGAVQKVHSAATGEEIIAGALNEQDLSEHMRVCNLCLRDLHFRESQMDKKEPPEFVQQYDLMKVMIEEVKNLVPTYVRVVTSLKNGESVYSHKHGEELRSKCLEIQKSIDYVSKKIAEGANDKPNSAKEQQLRKNIRLYAVQALQGLIGQMESLPTAEECSNLIIKRKERRAKDFARVNRTVMKMSSSMPQLQEQHSHLNSTSSVSSFGGPSSIDDGWSAEDNDLVFEPSSIEDDTIQTDHPLYEQREQLRKFLFQASATGKLDEMDILERNLKEIEEEMMRLGLSC
ncbi:FYVE-type domain-containing protein [Caenorhabditis elegans]|uniref:FYVE-type domain-containing protein n=1 Tax=Caenorhabditis elegans TaxID=6239 RepID=Q9N3Y4_CAEEL|nr:FYVE-type domain-containing protein [Caenorhabditis elegans]CCD71168.1 FYVE-type domain-containing protein [Caenorhabditis elegans]|eukprot:NP_501352.1 RABenoSyn (trafficking protein) homolog [Caenorhabditis elegans]